MLPTADQMATERKEEEMLDGPYKIFERDGAWYASMRTGDVVRTVEAGPDRDCAEAMLHLMKEGSR